MKEKIENLLKSSNLDEGLKLLKEINNEEVTESFSSLIQERVRENYFEGISDMSQVDKGLTILKEFTPNITSLDMSLCEMDSLDLSEFINLISLDTSYCSNLTNIQGLEHLKHLENLNVINSLNSATTIPNRNPDPSLSDLICLLIFTLHHFLHPQAPRYVPSSSFSFPCTQYYLVCNQQL